VRNLRDSIPKTIGHFLVKSLQDNMQIKLYNQLNKSDEILSLLNEVSIYINKPDNISEERIRLSNTLKILKEAQKILRRDPEYVIYLILV
jgi:hypothetical protein